MKVLVCGDREWADARKIEERLARLPAGTEIVEGACRGADRLAGAVARRLGFKVTEVPAEWGKYGKSAGPRRNRQMLDMLGPGDSVIAFHPDLSRSRGTADTVGEARRRGILTEVIG